jgi:hypothetical protein
MREMLQAILQDVRNMINAIEKVDDSTEHGQAIQRLREDIRRIEVEQILAWSMVEHFQQYADLVKSQRDEAISDRDQLHALCKSAIREAYQLGWWSYDQRGARLTWAPTLDGMLAMIKGSHETPLMQVILRLRQLG